jgi:hypothetical protein
MSQTLDPLILDLLQWIAADERSYGEVMEAWRTSCPRLPVWEEANERGLLARRCVNNAAMVYVTAAGHTFLRQRGLQSTSTVP